MPPTLCIAVAIDGAETESWLEAFDFASHGVRHAPIRLEGPGGSRPQVTVRSRTLGSTARTIPDLADVVAGLEETRADAVLLLSTSVLSQLVRFAADLLELPVFSLIFTEEELAAAHPRRKSRPDLHFLADAALFPTAARDMRYGLTLLATGHPARDDQAATRILGAIRDWAAGDQPAGPALSIVVPAYREAANLPLVCERLVGMLERAGLRGEILLVDDASPDETYAVALAQMWRSPMIRALTKPTPRGMGNAVRYGLRHARSPFVVITMGDGSDDVDRIPEMLRQVRDAGHALAIGSRYRARANYAAVPLLYRFWSACFRLTTRIVIGFRLQDYTNAFRLFDTRIFARYGPESGGFEISPEITFKAWLASRSVTEVDVKHLKRASGQSNFSFLRAGPGYGRILIKAFVARLTGRWFTLDW